MPAIHDMCECGCPRVIHQTVPLTVELPARLGGPLYKLPESGIVFSREHASRFADQCTGCGCMSFQLDRAAG